MNNYIAIYRNSLLDDILPFWIDHAVDHEHGGFMFYPDRINGEWYGHLHRNGRISVPLKGNLWKDPFHIPRMMLYCWKLLEEKSNAVN